MKWRNYRIKTIDDWCISKPCYVAQFSFKLLPLIWFDIKPKGLGSNFGTNRKGAEVYIRHDRRKWDTSPNDNWKN